MPPIVPITAAAFPIVTMYMYVCYCKHTVDCKKNKNEYPIDPPNSFILILFDNVRIIVAVW